jgi:hypothetical protein
MLITLMSPSLAVTFEVKDYHLGCAGAVRTPGQS